jgi:tripartite-type tricarboxylate transporter receptor subunit TctC
MKRSMTRQEVLKLGGGALAGAYMFALAGCGAHEGSGAQSEGAEDYPQQTLNWTIAFGPGGGNDIMSRTLIEILRQNELYTENIVATNLEGGDGARGWGYVYEQKGNPYHISSTSGSFMTTPLAADTPWGPTSFTPIGTTRSSSSRGMPLTIPWKSSSPPPKKNRCRSEALPPSTSTSSWRGSCRSRRDSS